ncbi:protection of telomeres protein 1, partial [Lecanoromycetidae sp. Uapishka_2]
MSSIVPPKFLDLKTAVTRLRANVNIIGVVTDFQLPVKSRGSDMMCRFSLADESYGESSDNGLMIRFFRPMQSELPALTGKGDVVLLRSIGIKEYSGMTIGVSNFQTSWTIFPGACFSTALSPSHLQLKHVKDPRAPVPTLSETEYTHADFGRKFLKVNDFVHLRNSEYDILSDAGSISNESDDDDPAASHDNDSGIEDERRWEWRFGLVLEDAMGSKSEKKATMEVFVVGQDAECLLKLDAENLRKSPEALETLREKLFLLWGDLEERKSREPAVFKQIDPNPRSPRKGELPKSKPFECCLKEYGVKRKVKQSNSTEESESGNDGDSESENCNDQKRVKRRNDWVWERKWRMFGCTIV